MRSRLEIRGGTDSAGCPESIERLELQAGESLALAGPTGSGKSEFLADIEQLAAGDTPSGRVVAYTNEKGEKSVRSPGLVATLSQRTNFIMDARVGEFAAMHAASLGKTGRDWARETADLANTLCGEPLTPESLLQRLSGGQARALMIADIALISDAPVVLIDEVENAGIDKHRAVEILAGHGKIAIMATHDPILILSSPRRLIMAEGGMKRLFPTNNEDRLCLDILAGHDALLLRARDLLRRGEELKGDFFQ
ncbi:MAG: ATP-binding cassette domain-containing protein [Deltaproteobacteria bacterium]|jgi:ABC-type lipoprotein export system ATPase subunit|nr:ATP-binding cassette domain-containing protein [Deltaproteobacteria bacterium]